MTKRQNRHTPKQIVKILREFTQSSLSVKEFCRNKEVSESNFYRWQNQYGSLNEKDAARLKALEKENLQLKRSLAKRVVEIDAFKELIEKKL